MYRALTYPVLCTVLGAEDATTKHKKYPCIMELTYREIHGTLGDKKEYGETRGDRIGKGG